MLMPDSRREALQLHRPFAALRTMDDDVHGPPRRRDRDTLRIAHFISLSGPAGIWGPCSINSAMLAVQEINARGGVLGREIEIAIHDAGAAPDEIADAATDIVRSGSADIILGSHMSAVRLILRDVFTGHLPYIYTPIYEGGERTPGLLAIGETPPRQARPAIMWLTEKKRARRWYLIGSDYVWPWQSHRAVKRYIAEAGGYVVGEDFVALGRDDHTPYLERIRAAQPDVVFISLIGLDGILFNRAFAEHGLAGQMLRLANCMDETVSLGIGADNTENLFAASGYFVNAPTAANEAFRDRYHRAFGCYAPVPGSTAQSNYEGLYFLDALSRRAGTLEPRSLIAAADGITYQAARGTVGIQRRRAEMPIYLAQADGLDFRLLAQF